MKFKVNDIQPLIVHNWNGDQTEGKNVFYIIHRDTLLFQFVASSDSAYYTTSYDCDCTKSIFEKWGKRETKSNEKKKCYYRSARDVPSCRSGAQFELGSSMIFMPFLVVYYRAMLTVVTTIVCLICYCCHRKIKMRASTSSLYRQQRWMDTDPSMEIYSVEQVSCWKFFIVGH